MTSSSRTTKKNVSDPARYRRKRDKPDTLKKEAEEYKEQHTVYLKSYLANPYRKVVTNPLEAKRYMDRLEKEYLPKIKEAIESALPKNIFAQRSYDF